MIKTGDTHLKLNMSVPEMRSVHQVSKIRQVYSDLIWSFKIEVGLGNRSGIVGMQKKCGRYTA